jgi:propanediol dehydratase small subunit
VLSLDAPLTFREFMTHEELPLATLFREVLRFLAGRTDAVVFGAHAVNAYCETERMTHHVDILSMKATVFAETLRAHLADRFHIAARIRAVAEERGYRIYQARQPKNRHLVDIRQVDILPESRDMEGVRVVAPIALIAMKVIGFAARRNRPKGDTDRADLRRLLLAFPDLKVESGEVAARLREMRAPEATLAVWRELATSPIEPDDDDEY